jgi:hypothetical protein
MVIKSDMGKAKHDKGGGKHGLMAPVGNQHWEKDAGEVDLKDFKYTTKDSMMNAEHLKKQVDKQQAYIKKNEMKYD